MLEELDPQAFGQLTGASVALFFVTWGIVKCARIMRRHTTDTCCVVALMVFLCGLFGNYAVSIGQRLFGWSQMAMMIWWPILMLIAIGSLVVGIVGLARFDRTRYVQGRSQAIWAIVLSSISMLIAIGAVTVGAFKANGGGSLWSATEKREEIGRFNCAITPPSGWRKLDPGVLRIKEAVAAYRLFSPEMYMTLVGERLPGLDLERYCELIKGNHVTAGKVLEETEETVELGGVSYRHIGTTIKIAASGLDLRFEKWIATRDGVFWQITIWGDVSQRERVGSEARKFFERFEVLSSERAGAYAGSLTDVGRPWFGYSTRLQGTGWESSNTLMGGKELFDFGAERGTEALVVVPVAFTESPAPDLEAATRGLLSTMNLEWPLPESNSTQKAWTSPAGEGWEITTEREVNGRIFEYILRVVRREYNAILVAGWAQKNGGDMERVRKAMDAIELTEPTGKPPAFRSEQRESYGAVLNSIGLSLFVRKRYEEAAHWFRQSFEQTRNDPTILDNLTYALQSAGKHKESLLLLDKEQSRFPKSIELQFRRASLLAANGDPDTGNTLFAKAIENGLNKESDLLSWINQLVELNRHDLADQIAEKWIAAHPSIKVQRWRAEVAVEAGDFPKAVSILETLVEENPNDLTIAVKLGELLNQSRDYSRASDVAEKLLAKSKDDLRALQILGWSQVGRKWYRDAKATFEKAALLRPNDEEIQDGLRFTSAALGQGSNSDIKQPLENVPIPSSLTAHLAEVKPPADFGKGEPAIVLLRATGYHFKKGTPARRTLHRRIKVLDQNGVNLYSSLEFPFDPLSERIYVNRLEVRSADGNEISKVSLDDAFVRDEGGELATNRKILQVQVPGLRPGCVIEGEITIEDRGSDDEFPFNRHVLVHRVPCVTEAIFVTGDRSKMKYFVTGAPGLKTMETDDTIAWFSGPMAPLAQEPFATPIESRVPVLWLSGTAKSWDAVGKDYLEQIADRLKPDDATKELATKLCRGLKKDREKIAVLARHVQRDVSYKGIEFGIRARRPNAASDVLRQGFGDCKDHALLLHQLLLAVNIESSLALVHSDHPAHSDLPSLDQFNHMVVHVPSLGSDWFIDATDKTLALDRLRPLALMDSNALVLDSTKPRLVSIPKFMPDDAASVTSHREIKAAGLDWQVQETLTVSGYYGALLRQIFTGRTPVEQSRTAQELLADVAPAELKDFQFENLDELSEPARLKLNYNVRNSIQPQASKSRAMLPALWERYYLNVRYLPNRDTPFSFWYPFHFTSEIIADESTKASFAGLPERGGDQYSKWDLSLLPDKGRTGLRFDFRIQPVTAPAKEYAKFYESWSAARRVWEKHVEW